MTKKQFISIAADCHAWLTWIRIRDRCTMFNDNKAPITTTILLDKVKSGEAIGLIKQTPLVWFSLTFDCSTKKKMCLENLTGITYWEFSSIQRNSLFRQPNGRLCELVDCFVYSDKRTTNIEIVDDVRYVMGNANLACNASLCVIGWRSDGAIWII